MAVSSAGPYASHLHCTSLQTDNHASTSSLFFTGQMLFLLPNQQRQSTEGKHKQYMNMTRDRCRERPTVTRTMLTYVLSTEVACVKIHFGTYSVHLYNEMYHG